MPISLIKIFTTHVLQWYFPLLLIQIRYTPVIIFTSWFLLPLNCYGSYFCLGPVIYGSLLSVSVFLLIEIKMLKGGSVSLVFLVFVTLGSIVLCVLSVWGCLWISYGTATFIVVFLFWGVIIWYFGSVVWILITAHLDHCHWLPDNISHDLSSYYVPSSVLRPWLV